MFDILSDTVNEVDLIRLHSRTSGERVSIAPRFGGNVCELGLNAGGQPNLILDGYTSDVEFAENVGFKGVKLIPFPNRVRDGKYSFEDASYQLPINRKKENHAIHGFFFKRPMEVERRSSSTSEASVILSSLYGGDFPGYPFELKVQITYSLHVAKGFACTTEVENFGRRAAPLGDGWHPYFTLGTKVDDLELKIPAKYQTEVDERMIPTGKVSPVPGFQTRTSIGNTPFDTGFALSKDEGIAVTEIHDPARHLTLEIWQETGQWKYNYLQVYIPPSRNSIAVEPMTCNANAFNNTNGLIVLKPGERFKASYGVKLA